MMVLAEFKMIAKVQPPEITIIAATNRGDIMDSVYREDKYLEVATQKLEEQYITERGEIVIERKGNILRTDKECYAAVYSQGIDILGEVSNEQ